MAIHLRPFQADVKRGVYDIWTQDPRENVLVVSATGSGKTVMFSDILYDHPGASVAIAHRQELVSQISMALARNGVRHRLIGASSLTKICVNLHMSELGRSYVEPSAMCGVAGVDTLIRMDPNDPWFQQVTLLVQDEAHHVLKKNKWGKAAQMFPNARMLGVTATPMRADGSGLGKWNDGLFGKMVLAPNMRDLIRMGYLTDYRIFAPPNDLDLSAVPTSAGGDFSPDPLRKAVHQAHIHGDVVEHYKRLAMGKLGVTFAVDVEAANEIAMAFNTSGVRAEVVSANTPDAVRQKVLRDFRERRILQLCNVDLFGEGFDLPAIEVVSMARPTQSFPLFCQQFGRALRLMLDPTYLEHWDAYTDEQRLALIAGSGKPHAIIIDHVSNVHRHGLPDALRQFSLERREKRGKSVQIIPVRTCGECGAAYERINLVCPYCGVAPPILARSAPHEVDGDLMELSQEALTRLRGGAVPVLKFPYDAHPGIVRHLSDVFNQKLDAQRELRAAMALWCGARTQASEGDEVRRVMKEFFFTYSIDVVSAQALNAADAAALTERIRRAV